MNELIKTIEDKFNEFLKESNKINNKSAQRRARIISLDLRELLKEFRKKSLENKWFSFLFLI